MRYVWHSAGIGFMAMGLIAVLKYTNARTGANLWSLHSWLGIITITMYLSQYFLGGYLFFYEGADSDMREAYIPIFAFMDILIYVSACFTAESGIVEKNTMIGCSYNLTTINNYKSEDPALYYTDLPSGCRISSGLGVAILFMCLCTVYAALELKLPELSNTAAGWEAYKLTEEEARRRVTWPQYFMSLLPFGSRKRTTKAKATNEGRGARSGRKKSNWVEKNDGDGKKIMYHSDDVLVPLNVSNEFSTHPGAYYYNTKTQESTKSKPADF